MPKNKSKESFSHKLLKAGAISSVLVIAATNPYFVLKAIGASRKDLERKKWWEYKKAINNLKRQKRLNVSQNPDGSYTLEITQVGKKVIEKYDLDSLKIEKPDQWDGGWRVLSFDIPKNKKNARQALLSKIKELGFLMLQKSVWVHPFECRKELAVISKAFEVEPYIYSFVAYEFENDKEYKLRKTFESRSGLNLSNPTLS